MKLLKHKTQDERLDDMQQGQAARLVHSEMADRLADREQAIISSLVSSYRAKSLTDQEARGAIAAISELRTILSSLERDIQRGIESSELEFNERPGA